MRMQITVGADKAEKRALSCRPAVKRTGGTREASSYSMTARVEAHYAE